MQGDPELAGRNDFQTVKIQPAFAALSVAGSGIIESAASCVCVNSTYNKRIQSTCTFNCYRV